MSSSSIRVKVAEEENQNGVELLAESDMSLKEDTVSSKFPECFALAYKSNNSNKWKYVIKENDKFLPPQGGWGKTKYVCVKGKKIKFKLTNLGDGLTGKQIQEYLESYGIVEIEKFNKHNKTAYVIIRFITDTHLKNMKTQQHPFKTVDVAQTDREKYTQRPGTINKGHKFEELTMASLLLNLTLDEDVRDFKLSSNDLDFGNFDDIVVEVELINGDKHKYAIQLKYKNDQKQSLKKYLSNVSGDFSIQKYFKDFTEMIDYTKNYNLILFTNLKFNIREGELLKLGNTNTELQIVEETFFREFGESVCYKFYPVSSEITNQHKMFFDKFLLYPNQPTVEKMERRLSEKFNFEFSFKNIANYLKFISEWNNANKSKKKTLNKTFIKQLIALQILGASIKSFPEMETRDNENTVLFKKATFEFSVTVVDKKYFKNIKRIWENEIMKASEIEAIINDFELKYLSEDDKRVVALWIMNRCPLIITESQTAYKVISLCREKRFVLLKEDDTAISTQNLKVFMKLTDLDPHSTIYKCVIKSFYCIIKGEQASLEELIKRYTNFEHSVSTNELIQMIDDPLSIGKQEAVLDIYIERFVTRLTVDYKFFDSIDKDTSVIISCQGKESILKHRLKTINLINIEDYLNKKGRMQVGTFRRGEHNTENFREIQEEPESQMETFRSDTIQTEDFGSIGEKTAYFSKNQCARKTFDIISKRNPNKKCHHFRIIENDVLEWMYSKGEISDLQKFKTSSSFIKETDVFNKEDAIINIITADPGMGKTEMMKKFHNMCSSTFWTILIIANDWSEYLQRKNYSKERLFEIILKNVCKTQFEVDILKVMKKTRRIMFLWDGLDELSSTQLDNIIELIDDLVKEGFQQWISCRKHLQDKLEKKFNVLSRSIKQFDKEEQTNYIYRRLSSNEKINLEEVVHKIHDYTDTVQYNQMLGIPLQIFMLTELLLNDSKLLHNILNKIFPITDLYAYFINMKLEIFIKEKIKLAANSIPCFDDVTIPFHNNMLQNHQRLALLMVLEEQFVEKLNIHLNSAVPEDETIYRIGIITGKTENGRAKFLHYSYAEYLVALYFYEHRVEFNMLIKEHLFQENYQNVRFMFDLLLSKNCSAHLAVLYNNFDYLKICGDYTCKDEGGRNPLQIACAWGPRFPLLKTVQQDDDFLIDDEQANVVNTSISSKQYYEEMLSILLVHNSVVHQDLLFHLNSIEYADMSSSLQPLAIFLKEKYYFTFNTLKNFKNISTVLYYSVKFNYTSILQGLQNIPFLKTIKKYNTIMHLASENNCLDCIKVLLRDENHILEINAKNHYCETPVFKAAEAGHYEVVKYLAESGADVNIQNQDGFVPIHIAALKGHIEVIKLLVNDLKANVNAKTKKGFTPIYCADENGHYEVVKYLAESGADVNIQDQEGWVPIHRAALNGHIEVVKLLVNNLKANVNAKSKKGFTPIYCAAQNGHYEVVKYLAESGADANIQNQDGCVPVHMAAQNGHIEVVKLLVNNLKANVNAKSKKGPTPIYLASLNGHYEVVKCLAESGADVNIPNQDGYVPIHLAAINGHIEVVKLLVHDLKVNVNAKIKKGSTPIYYALLLGHYDLVMYLAESGADVNIQDQDGLVPIHIAALKGYIEVVKLLVNDLKADVNAMNKEGFTPIYGAAEAGHYEVVKYLAKSGADVNIQNQYGWVPLHTAAVNGHIEVVKLLVHDLKTNVNAKSKKGSTAIYLAAYEGHYEVVKYLAESGAEVNIQDKDGDVPMHVAASYGQMEVVKLLVNNQKVNVNAKNNRGFTPIYNAAENGHYEVVKYLAESGTDVNVQNLDGWAPIHIAARNGHIEVVKLLVNDLKANVISKNNKGFTPLDLAGRNSQDEVVEYLTKLIPGF